MSSTNLNIFNELNDSFEKEIENKQSKAKARHKVLSESLKAKKLKESEESKKQILNEDNSDAFNRIKHGEKVYFRDSQGVYCYIDYADDYEEPEEYDNGYTSGWEKGKDPKYDKEQEDRLNSAKEAAEYGNVWEVVECDKNCNPTGNILTYAYGEDELKYVLDGLREVKIKTELEESKITESDKELDMRKINKSKKITESIRDEKTGHLKRIQVSKKIQDKMADKYNKKQELNESKKSGYIIFIKDDPDGYSYQGCGGRSRVRLDMTDALDVYDTVEQAQKEVNTYKNPKKIKIMKFDGKNTTELNESCNKKGIQVNTDRGIYESDSLLKEAEEVDKVKNLKLINQAAHSFNDEDLIDVWLTNGVPDGATEEDFEEIVNDTDSTYGTDYSSMIKLFTNLVKKAVEDKDSEYTFFECPEEAFNFVKNSINNNVTNVTRKELIGEGEELDKTKLEDRLASLKAQLEVDGDQLADDEKESIEKEIADLEAKVYPIKESSIPGDIIDTVELTLDDKGPGELRFVGDIDKYGYYQGEVIVTDYDPDYKRLYREVKKGDKVKADIIKVPEEQWNDYGLDDENPYYINFHKDLKEDNNIQIPKVKVEVDKDGNKSIRDEKTGHLKKITISKKTQDKMAAEHNKKLDQKEKLNEAGEWDESDEDLLAWKEALRDAAEEIARNVDGEVKIVKGFDAYQGPFAIIATPKHGDIELWSGPEEDLLDAKVAHVGWLEGSIGDISEYLNQDEIPQEAIINESEKFSGKELKDNNKMSYEDWVDYIDIKEKYPEWFKNKSELNRPFLDIVNDHQDELWNDYQEYLKEDTNIQIPEVKVEPDYIINDVTELDQTSDGDVQAPDIDSLITLVDENLTAKYGKDWGHIKILSSAKMNENSSYALVDISTKEIIKEFENSGINDVAIGKNLIIESAGNYINFKVNSLNGNTRFSKKTKNAAKTITEWVETEFLHESMIEDFQKQIDKRHQEEKDAIENYIKTRPELKTEIDNIKMFIELNRINKDENIDKILQDRMYGFAAEFPNTISVTTDNKNKSTLKFSNLEEIVAQIFGKQYVRKTEEAPKVIDLKEKKINESYEQFNIGDIEVVFNPDTYECLYSIPTADVKDKKVNLSDIPTVDTPYDTNTIIKSYVETKFGKIPGNAPDGEEKAETADTEVADTPVTTGTTSTEDTTPVNTDINEDELPEEPEEDTVDTETPAPEEVDKDTQEDQSETGSTKFVKIRPKQSVNIEEIRERMLEGDTPESQYIVVDHRVLSQEDWDKLTGDLTIKEPWLANVKSVDRKNYSFNVIEVSGPNTSYSLLIDPLGYDYPRYLGIKDNA